MENICTKEKKSKSTKDDKAEKQLVLDKTDGDTIDATISLDGPAVFHNIH